MQKTRAFIASSLDGYIAGPDDELDWLPQDEGVEDTFTPFFEHIGAMLMGRRTFDVVSGFDGAWPYGETPIVVATSRALATPLASVTSAAGDIAQLIDRAKQLASGRDVYIDGGALIRSAMDAGLVDEITVTMIPIVLGAGLPLFAGCGRHHPLDLLNVRIVGCGMVALTYAPARPATHSGAPLGR